MNTCDIIADHLINWGVDTIFGIPGDGINGMIEGLRKRQDKIRFVLVRHEEAAAFAAVAYAKFKHKLGVCLATSGPGGIHLLNGLYDAHMDNMPVLAITGRTYSDLISSGYQQDVDLLIPFSGVAGYNTLITNPAQADLATDLACRYAISNNDVSHISIPIDVQEEEFKKKYETEHKVEHMTSNAPTSTMLPDRNSLDQAANILNGGKRVVIFCGAGALNAGEELVELSRKIKSPIVKALLGKASVPDDDPNCLGGLGLLGTLPAQLAMERADTILMVGTSFPFADYLPKPGQAKGVQIDIKAEKIGSRFPVLIGLVGDAKATLRELNPLVLEKSDETYLHGLQFRMKEWWEEMAERSAKKDKPLKPQTVAWGLGEQLDDDAIICTDSGTITTWAARYIKLRKRQMFSCSGTLASMANGLPYAIGAQIAYPDRQVVAFVGDGGLAMLMGDFSTAVLYKLPIKVVVIKNGALQQIRWEQIGFLGNPEYAVKFQDIDFVKFAEACGGVGYRIEDYDEIRPTISKALAEKKPTIVEALVDPNEPPYPAQLGLKYVENFAKALAKGEPQGGRIALTLFREKLEEKL